MRICGCRLVPKLRCEGGFWEVTACQRKAGEKLDACKKLKKTLDEDNHEVREQNVNNCHYLYALSRSVPLGLTLYCGSFIPISISF